MEKNKNNTPVLRFPEFEGEWERKRLGEVVTNKSGKYNPEKENNFIKCIELEHIEPESGLLLGFIDGSKSGSIKNKFEKGDVLFGKLRPYLKKHLKAPFDGVCSSEIWVLKGINTSNEFLYRIVQTDKFIDLANQSSGSKMPRADWSVVEKGIIFFPTLPEQQKIAAFFTAIDKKLQGLKEKKSLLEAYKKGVMQQLFAQEIRFKNAEGGDFEDWEVRRFGEVVTNKSGKYNPENENGFIKCIELEHLTSESGQLLGYINGSNSGSIKNKFKKGDVLFGKLRPYLKKYLQAPFDGVCSSEIWVLKGIGISNDFLYRLVQTNNFIDLANQSSGSKMPRADWSVVENGIFFIPSLPEQTLIADYLSALDAKIAGVSGQIGAMEAWKKGLLQNMFV